MDWLKKLKQYAPDIATAVLTGGATLPQLAIKAIADATGNEVSTQDELQKAVESASPEMMLKNNLFKSRMRELDNDLVATKLGDVQDARKNHKHSKMPAAICIGLSVIVAILSIALIFEPIPAANNQMLNMLIGQIVAAWMASIAYWVGTTRSSANKDRNK